MSDSTDQNTVEPKRGFNYKILLLIVGLADVIIEVIDVPMRFILTL